MSYSSNIEKQYGIKGLTLTCDEAQIQAQNALPASKMKFEQALDKAIQTILTDDKNPESPRSLVKDVFSLSPSQPNGEANLQAKIKELLGSGSLRLLPNVDWSDMEKDYGFFPPENGETAADNWVFFLSLPELSDHLYWVIIDRQGSKAPYVYGFN